jgi:hypothetical protein
VAKPFYLDVRNRRQQEPLPWAVLATLRDTKTGERVVICACDAAPERAVTFGTTAAATAATAVAAAASSKAEGRRQPPWRWTTDPNEWKTQRWLRWARRAVRGARPLTLHPKAYVGDDERRVGLLEVATAICPVSRPQGDAGWWRVPTSFPDAAVAVSVASGALFDLPHYTPGALLRRAFQGGLLASLTRQLRGEDEQELFASIYGGEGRMCGC